MDVHVDDGRAVVVAPDRLARAASVTWLLVHLDADGRSSGDGAESGSRSSAGIASDVLWM